MAQHQMTGEIGRAAVDRTRTGQHVGSVGLVMLIAIMLVGATAGLVLVGRANAEPYILALLAVLAMVGVFLLFALAAGILRAPGKEAAHYTRRPLRRKRLTRLRPVPTFG